MGVTRAVTLPRCPERGGRDSGGCGTGGIPGISAGLVFQLPYMAWAGSGGGKGSIPALGKHGLCNAARSCCCHPKLGSEKGTPLTDNRRLKKGIHPENCPLLKHCIFFPNSEKYPNLYLSSSWGPGSQPRDPPSFPAAVAWDHPGPALHAWIDFQPHKEPWRPFEPRTGTPVTPHIIPAYPGRAVNPEELQRSPTPLSSLPSLPMQCCTLCNTEPFPALGQPEEG